MKRADMPNFGHPSELPLSALGFWPDLRDWPSLEEVDRFKRGTRRQPAARLAVLTGLRSWSSVDLAPIWAWVGGIIALGTLASSVVIAVAIPWIQIVSVAVAVAGGIAGLTALANLHGNTDIRRRRALVWLRAFEDALER